MYVGICIYVYMICILTWFYSLIYIMRAFFLEIKMVQVDIQNLESRNLVADGRMDVWMDGIIGR